MPIPATDKSSFIRGAILNGPTRPKFLPQDERHDSPSIQLHSAQPTIQPEATTRTDQSDQPHDCSPRSLTAQTHFISAV